MKNNLCKAAAAVSFSLLCSLAGYSQTRTSSRAWELGLGGSVMNVTRTTVSDFHQTAGGDYIFNLDEKLVHGGVQLYGAVALGDRVYADLQGNLGFARYYDSGGWKQGYSLVAGPGLQLRPFVRSQWIQPYLRLGVAVCHKNFPTAFYGQFEGDVTKEASWKSEDAWNRGYTFDDDFFFPLSAGAGVIGWMSERAGVHLQGLYFRSVGTDGFNFAQVSAGLVFRLGGASKSKAVADRYISSHLDEYAGLYPAREVVREVVKEVPVEVVREVVKEVPSEKTIAEMMDNINFDYDKATLTADSQLVLDDIASTLLSFPDSRFLVAGYTDAKGSQEYNDNLSTQRAKAVYEALVARGVSTSRLCYRGFGKRVALVPASASDDERKGDRKVVLERVMSDSMWEHINK